MSMLKLKKKAWKTLSFGILAWLITTYCMKHFLVENFSKNLLSNSLSTTRHNKFDVTYETFKEFHGLPFSEIKCGENVVKNSTSNGKKLLVPDVVFFIWLGKDLEFRFFNYLALRSAASIQQPKRIDFYYNEDLPKGKHWQRAVNEIPCLHFKKIEDPNAIGGVEIRSNMLRTDLARLQILIKEGGIYVDGDAITLKSLDSLRVYPATVGRATKDNVCVCIALSRKNSLFMIKYFNYFEERFRSNSKLVIWRLFTESMGEYMKQTMVNVHVEESSFNRPNPYIEEDGEFSTITGNFDISDNYFLHLHTSSLWEASSDAAGWLDWEEDELRKLDTVYGEAARLALFGSSDLVFLPGETVFDKKEKHKMVQFPPIQQPEAVIDDTDFDILS